MGRVLKLGMSLFGGLALLLIATLWIARRDDETQWLVIEGKPDGTLYDSNRLYALDIEGNNARPLTASYSAIAPTWSPADQQLYYYADFQSRRQYFTIEPTNPAPQILLNGTRLHEYELVIQTPDQAWMVYFASGQLYRARPDGRDALALSPLGLAARGPALISDDSEWVIFGSITYPQNPAIYYYEPHWDIYRVRLDGSGLENLTYYLDDNISPQLWLPDGDWFAATSREALYYLRVDGWQSVRVPLNSSNLGTPDWIPQVELLVLDAYMEDVIFAYKIGTTEPLWQRTRGAYESQSPDGQWIVMEHEQDLTLMRSDGTALTTLSDRHNFRQAVWSSDSQWVAFERYNPTNGKTELWRRRVANGVEQLIHSSNNNPILLAAWSPDGAWLLYWEFINEDRGSFYRIRPDGTGRQQLTPQLHYYYNHAWIPPLGQGWQPAVLLFGAGLCSMMPFIGKRFRRKIKLPLAKKY